jgi:glucose-1-phosphate cytidylyltransferase
MKVVIFAGGRGSRIAEETNVKPKPMVEIGGHPILWHIMKIYAAHGICDFIVCLGYKGYVIKEYFANYYLHTADVTFDLTDNKVEVNRPGAEPWRVTLVDTGNETETGGRLKRVSKYLDEDLFCLTYGDGVGDIDIGRLIAFHRGHGLLATVTAVRPPGRFGAIELDDTIVTSFTEKPRGDGGWINGGFFVMSADALRYIEGDRTVLEQEPLRNLAQNRHLAAYRHEGFWHPMDTLRDNLLLEQLWNSGKAPWKVW